jgi:two-component system phosphate regulon sensor histidine kinase PhoR
VNRGIRARLLLASLAVFVVVAIPATLLLRHQLTTAVEARVRAELEAQARMVRIALLSSALVEQPRVQQVAHTLARETGIQVDVVGFDRALIASSDDRTSAGPPLDQPELRAARSAGLAYARRGGRAHVAIRVVAPGQAEMLVRVSRPLDELDDAYDRMYELVAIAALLGVAVAAGLTWLAAWMLTREVRRLAVGASALAGGGGNRISVDTADELGDLGGSINRLADGAARTGVALARERELLDGMLETVSQGIVALDERQRIALLNEAARAILELRDAPVGAPLIDHVRAPALVELLASPGPSSTELLTARGTRVLVAVRPMRDGGRILMVEDVTAVRRLETIRRDFVANVSHELRTPVSVIRASAETLLAGAKDDPEFSTKLLDSLHRNAERLGRILADLLDLSRLEAGSYRLTPRSVNVGDAVDKALGALAQERRAERTITVAVAPGLAALADAEALDHVLVNLLDNACKYTPAGGAITVAATARDGALRIDVRDDGPGIAPRHRERIFERFYRVDPGRSRELGGTGLGLSIVKHLVESMQGRVGVEPNHPRGTVFWIELPPA